MGRVVSQRGCSGPRSLARPGSVSNLRTHLRNACGRVHLGSAVRRTARDLGNGLHSGRDRATTGRSCATAAGRFRTAVEKRGVTKCGTASVSIEGLNAFVAGVGPAAGSFRTSGAVHRGRSAGAARKVPVGTVGSARVVSLRVARRRSRIIRGDDPRLFRFRKQPDVPPFGRRGDGASDLAGASQNGNSSRFEKHGGLPVPKVFGGQIIQGGLSGMIFPFNSPEIN